jgi:stage II sporulation protein D
VVDRVRFEPLTPSPDATVTLHGTGDYRGALDVGRDPAGGLAVVNQLGLEDYVKGISEVPNAWPLEALKAQAIAARTYALRDMSLKVATAAKAAGADICATDACQVYAGVAKERQEGGANWAEAVRQTAGQVVLYKGAPINAKYSSSNGGRSVAGGYPYLRAVDDPDDAASPLHRWRSTLALSDAAAALGLAGTIDRVTHTADAVVVDWHSADGTQGQAPFPTADFRAKLNVLPPPLGLPKTVPSFRFTTATDPAGNTLTIDGAGWGHGVGLSQWGAYGKARRGLKATDILAAYYSGLRPTALPANQLPATIRVAVALARPEVTAGGAEGSPARFRVLDGAGKPLAVSASGAWRVVPEGKAVRVIPPAGQDQPPAVHALAVDPAAPAPSTPMKVRFHLSAPAVVKLTLTDPAGAPLATLAPRLVDAGEISEAVPLPATPGRYVLTVSADAGGGRTAAAPLNVDVAAPAPRPAASDGDTQDGRPVLHPVLARFRAEPRARTLAPLALLSLGGTAMAGVLVALSPVRRRGRRDKLV